ncbi:hypothetical protein AB6A40_010331 [Gnathostoma spinigerum]|uniref:Abnormal cell migration protein 18-like fibronectin type I domain-containing protein n=1 Tax=Gnathostoma spinigerum TaxID=75299 RepID=A0ABD6EWX7_9BILA
MRSLIFLAIIALAIGCRYEGKTYENGDTWVAKNIFTMQCNKNERGWNTKIIGCLTPKSTKIPIDGVVHEDGKEYACKGGQNGHVSYSAKPL